MKANDESSLRVSPEEAVRICRTAGTLEDVYYAIDIYDEWWSDPKRRERYYDRGERACMMAALLIAGRIQGIREERQRQRSKNKPGD